MLLNVEVVFPARIARFLCFPSDFILSSLPFLESHLGFSFFFAIFFLFHFGIFHFFFFFFLFDNFHFDILTLLIFSLNLISKVLWPGLLGTGIVKPKVLLFRNSFGNKDSDFRISEIQYSLSIGETFQFSLFLYHFLLLHFHSFLSSLQNFHFSIRVITWPNRISVASIILKFKLKLLFQAKCFPFS